MTKILHLTLKKKWFDLIASGEKKEEYREIKAYWVKRLLDNFNWDETKNPIKLNRGSYSVKPFNIIQFKNGYSKDAPTIKLEFVGIVIDEGNPEWGAEPGVKYFVIELGEIIP